MDVITIESKAFKELISKVDMIARFVNKIEQTTEINVDDEWVDSYDVRTYLNISKRTLQRLRSERLISFTPQRGKYYYQISEIKRLMRERVIKCDQEQLSVLLTNRKRHVEQIFNSREDE
ncbi:MAG: helix-turn-helix domain-containing protein [Bacteroidales bacterium]|jgi:hypothetical protein|nr:helix-turn-helix domain-containing protein [Bacteroidales bacterium]